jgi:hypothetical protein
MLTYFPALLYYPVFWDRPTEHACCATVAQSMHAALLFLTLCMLFCKLLQQLACKDAWSFILCSCCCARRFNFGKALWYFPRTAAPISWTIAQMQVTPS